MAGHGGDALPRRPGIPAQLGTGELVGAGITFTDVTRYRRLQVALQEARRDAETAGEELQATVEELETTNEELQATNEELETTNEELQATNEELETMNEELESTNEELETMNDEIHVRSMSSTRPTPSSRRSSPASPPRSSSTARCACRRGTPARASSGA